MSNRQLRELGAMRNFMDQMIRPDLENLAHRVDSLEKSNDGITSSIDNIERDLQRNKDDTLNQIQDLSASIEIMKGKLDSLSSTLRKLLTVLGRKGLISTTNPGKVSSDVVNNMSNDHIKDNDKSVLPQTNSIRSEDVADTSGNSIVTPPKGTNSAVLSPINIFGQGSVSTNQYNK